jgi:hypothetical protein
MGFITWYVNWFQSVDIMLILFNLHRHQDIVVGGYEPPRLTQIILGVSIALM